ncbi:alpha-tocopherol transfer protein-like [Dermacentor silvarum]|uniref:alpha-tocopherol transfer protein-like n=1 Tax=Dermacentor silvarum TaxID=543639 RepID=UPI001899DF63|nr:alpha-tocopherol transfer protein-like [Dermacentor silvarum]
MLGVYRKKTADDVFDTSEEALPLSLQRVATEELGETPSKRKEALEKLTKLVSAETELNSRRDTDFLLRFLRVRKYNVEAALQSIKNYYRNRAASDSVYRDFLPSKVPLAARRLCLVLPQRDARGRPIVFCHVGHWNPEEITYATLQQALLMCLEHVISDPVAQTIGIVIMVDYVGFTIDKVLSMSLGLIRRLLEYFQDCMPARLKAVHILNQPYAFDVIFAVVKAFIKSKMAERMHMHGENYERFHEEVSPSTLPREYGGHGLQFDFDAFWRLMDAQEDTFASGNHFGYVVLDHLDIHEDDQMPLQLSTL